MSVSESVSERVREIQLHRAANAAKKYFKFFKIIFDNLMIGDMRVDPKQADHYLLFN